MKLSLFGNSPIITPRMPQLPMEAANKQYVDDLVSAHASNTALHLTSAQNTWLDAITVTSAEVNFLSGVTSNIQSQLDAKFDKTGGTINGNVTIGAGFKITQSASPTSSSDLVNKAYVDSLVAGAEWKNPITDPNLISDDLNTPPVSPVVGDVYIIGDSPTGDWAGKAGYAAYYNGTRWVFLQNRPVAVGDRFGVAIATTSVPSAALSVYDKKIVTITSATPGSIAYTADVINPASTVLVFDPDSPKFGTTYTYTDEGKWVLTNVTVNITAGDGLSLSGNALNVNPGNGITIDTDTVAVNLASDAGLEFDSGALRAKLDGSTLTRTVNGLKVSNSVINDIGSRVAKSGDTMTGALTLSGNPTNNLHAAPKQYVDSVVAAHATDDTIHLTSAQKTWLDAITVSSTEVNHLAGVTGNVQTQLDAKVDKAGDTMTGALTLSGDPTAGLHAATKQYVDNNVSTRVAKSGDTMTGYLTLHADPVQAKHAATKQYVDNVAQSLKVKPAVRVATTANLPGNYNNGTYGVNATLTGTSNGVLVVDGVTLTTGDRVLVKDQTDPIQNGDYVVTQPGSPSTPFILTRTVTMDESSEVPGSYFYVYDGLTLKGTGWVITVANPRTFTIGKDAITVSQFSGQGSIIAGTGLTLTGNTLNVNTASPTRIVVNADNIDLATTGVTAGSYTKLTVDAYGRVTNGSNPTTLAGYGITDAQPLNTNLTGISNLSTNGIVVITGNGTSATRSIVVSGTGLSITNDDGVAGDITIASNATSANTAGTVVARDSNGNFSAGTITANLNGNASTATTLQTARNFSITGDVTASAVSFNGSTNVTLNATLVDTGVTAGTYNKVTVDAKGRVIAATNATTIAALGVTDVYTKAEVDALISNLVTTINELMVYIQSRYYY